VDDLFGVHFLREILETRGFSRSKCSVIPSTLSWRQCFAAGRTWRKWDDEFYELRILRGLEIASQGGAALTRNREAGLSGNAGETKDERINHNQTTDVFIANLLFELPVAVVSGTAFDFNQH
jgi:hypothetical protein